MESVIPDPRIGRISANLVSSPPEEEDHRKGDHPDELRVSCVIILYPESCAAEDHPRNEEEEQGGDSKSCPYLASHDPG